MKVRFLCAALLSLPGWAAAQNYQDLTFTRGRPSAYSSVVQLQAGVIGGLANDKDKAIGLDNEIGWDGHLYYHDERFGGREAVLDAYVGRDGAYLGVAEGNLLGGENVSRIELTARYWPFYREGFYRDGDFVPTGRYEGEDYGVKLGFLRQIDEGLVMEVGPFVRWYNFDNNDTTGLNYIIPDDYIAWGGRALVEHDTLVVDRVTGRPRQGYLATLMVESEWNDSDRNFGVVGTFQSDLPRTVWRGRGNLEFYAPWSTATTWVIRATGQLSDDEDRVYNFDAQKPPGHLWVDGELGMRFDLGQSFAVRPYGLVQFVQLLEENGVSNQDEIFFGGGVALDWGLSENLTVIGEDRYLQNEYRPPISVEDDTIGEHQFFFGVQIRFGGQRK